MYDVFISIEFSYYAIDLLSHVVFMNLLLVFYFKLNLFEEKSKKDDL
jgi:hypothetical protein